MGPFVVIANHGHTLDIEVTESQNASRLTESDPPLAGLNLRTPMFRIPKVSEMRSKSL